jgi:hypothetical protein
MHLLVTIVIEPADGTLAARFTIEVRHAPREQLCKWYTGSYQNKRV